jgi:hypothetical protein
MTPEVRAACDFYAQLGQELTESGELVDTAGVPDPSHTVRLARTGGEVVATDGPFAEAKESLASFAIVDCESHDRAVEIARRCAAALGDTFEMRPLYGAGDGFDSAAGEVPASA